MGGRSRLRCDAWERMRGHAEHRDAPLMPRRRWRWHDRRHTFALQLLSNLERLMDGDEPDAVAPRRHHTAYLGGHIKHNPLLIVSRRLGVVERLAISARKSTSFTRRRRAPDQPRSGCPGAAATNSTNSPATTNAVIDSGSPRPREAGGHRLLSAGQPDRGQAGPVAHLRRPPGPRAGRGGARTHRAPRAGAAGTGLMTARNWPPPTEAKN